MMALTFFDLCCEHRFLPLDEVLKIRPGTPEVLRAAARQRLEHLARLAVVVEQEGSLLPRDAMRLFASEVGTLVDEVGVLLARL